MLARMLSDALNANVSLVRLPTPPRAPANLWRRAGARLVCWVARQQPFLLLGAARRLRGAVGAAMCASASLMASPAHSAGAPTADDTVRAVRVTDGLVHPWSLAFLPDGRMLVTERPGRLRLVGADGRLGPPVPGVPAVDERGQCGLLDVAVDPDFAQNQRIWLAFAEAAPGGNRSALASATWSEQGLTEVRVVFRQAPAVSSGRHCGARIVFDRQGHVLLGLGDRGSRMDDAQDLSNHIGKVVRLARDGSVPADNPFVSRQGAAPEVFSWGHRNIQGAALHPGTGELWAVEHGPQGGDELNIVRAGRNYGWPLLTYGRNYGSGTRIGDEGPREGFEQPLRHWLPVSVAPSGMSFVTTDRYPGWKGSLLIGTLRSQQLIRLSLDGNRVTREHRLLERLSHRIRDVREAPDGRIYLLTDSPDGQLLRLEP
jgi:glucose/arabinose dehydrogenase